MPSAKPPDAKAGAPAPLAQDFTPADAMTDPPIPRSLPGIDTVSRITPWRWTRETRYYQVFLEQDLWAGWILTQVNGRHRSPMGPARAKPPPSIQPALLVLAHLSPLGWEHINLTGNCAWEAEESLNPGHFRPLRTRHSELPMAT